MLVVSGTQCILQSNCELTSAHGYFHTKNVIKHFALVIQSWWQANHEITITSTTKLKAIKVAQGYTIQNILQQIISQINAHYQELVSSYHYQPIMNYEVLGIWLFYEESLTKWYYLLTNNFPQDLKSESQLESYFESIWIKDGFWIIHVRAMNSFWPCLPLRVTFIFYFDVNVTVGDCT